MHNLPPCNSCKYGCERCHAPLNQYQNAIIYIVLCRWVERNAKKMNVVPQVGLTCFFHPRKLRTFIRTATSRCASRRIVRATP